MRIDQQQVRHQGHYRAWLFAGVTLAALSTGLMGTTLVHAAAEPVISQNSGSKGDAGKPVVPASTGDDDPQANQNSKNSGDPLTDDKEQSGDGTGDLADKNGSAAEKVTPVTVNAKYQRRTRALDIPAAPTPNADVTPTPDATGADTAGLQYALNSDQTAYTVTGYTGDATAITIPEQFENLNVTAIADKAFANGNLTSVIIGDKVGTIGASAFANNKLTSLTIGNEVQVIGASAFENNLLETIDFRANQTGSGWLWKIGAAAFKGNQLKGTLTLPVGVAEIDTAAFENNLLESIDFKGVQAGSTSLWDIDTAAFKNNRLKGILKLPAGVKNIGDSAFEGSDQEAITENQLTGVDFGVRPLNDGKNLDLTIGVDSFNYNALTSIALPDGTTTVKDTAFANNHLVTATLGTDLTTIGNGAFQNNLLQTITIPKNVDPIGNSAFANNQLTEVTFLDGRLDTIGVGAFEENHITSLKIPDSVRIIQGSAFTENPQLTSLELGNHVDTIGAAAFAGDAISGNLTFPDSVRVIGNTAFAGNQLTGVTFGNQHSSKLETIGSAAFVGNPGLTGELVIPDQVNFINAGAFSGDALTGIDFGKSTGTIGNGAFANNKLVGTLTLSDGIEHINSAAFQNNALTGLKLGQALMTILGEAFAGNQIAGDLVIPSKVTTIGEQSFTGNQLSRLTLGDSVATIGTSAFADNALVGDVLPDDDTSAEHGLTIPASVTSIGKTAFADNALVGVTFAGTVDSIDNEAFAGNNLQKIQAADPVTHLGDQAFADQQTLTAMVGHASDQLTGVKTAIAAALKLRNFSLTDPMVFTHNGTPLSYDSTTDRLTLPSGFTGTSLVLTLSSGTTGQATDHSGNYGVNQLTLKWTDPSSGGSSGTTDPVSPDQPTPPTIPVIPGKTPTAQPIPSRRGAPIVRQGRRRLGNHGRH
ncbi:hypothetical protein FD13_GL001810 [Levilactobacillus senmaizukei DSM 21775 = NBRC 103853]|uniref:Adhesion exoprotein n=2 Tax=Levilactobacillus senmaizukei TaxID=431273 RepID=A0A0R2DQN5_9LACO|nr:leucine-rich repeat domain-containing protein [Levilactobacillus senmaizukei]KRN02586.1 hypothetical protein FD13_GL001810 [Levilactobacillus senmaizukei DSM 21775 = NBRC 103853]